MSVPFCAYTRIFYWTTVLYEKSWRPCSCCILASDKMLNKCLLSWYPLFSFLLLGKNHLFSTVVCLFIEQFAETCLQFSIDLQQNPISYFKSMNDFAEKRLAKPFRFTNISLGILGLMLPLLVRHESGVPVDLPASVNAFAQGSQDCEPLMATDVPPAFKSFLPPFCSIPWVHLS